MGQTKRNILLTNVSNLCPGWDEDLFNDPLTGVDNTDAVLKQIARMKLFAGVWDSPGKGFQAEVFIDVNGGNPAAGFGRAKPGTPVGTGVHKTIAAHALLWALVDYLEKAKS